MSPTVEVIETSELGDRSYVAHDGEVAVAIDPQRDLDRVERVLAELGMHCEVVLETHIHNDYVSGGLELARRTGARYAVSAAEPVEFDRLAVADGDELRAGRLRIQAIATPGHTDHHLSYRITDAAGTGAVFTGGSLLYGSVGRTDLVDESRTEELTRAQFRSAHRLVELAGDEDRVFPTHGFGSFCSSGAATGGDSSTIGAERARNDALTVTDEDIFVQRLVTNLSAYPSYYAHMDPRNRAGAGPADLSPPTPVRAEELAKRLAAGEWVVDLRDRTAYAAAHLGGSVGIELGQQFATYLGWLMPWGSRLTLIGESREQVAGAQRQLVRIGIERPAGAAVGTPDALAGGGTIRAYPVVSFAQLAEARSSGDVVVLDVRGEGERAAGSIPGSAHMPVYSIVDRLEEVPPGRLWVHCASGYRASIAASLLERAGRDVVLVDDAYDAAVESGLGSG
jgi:glyoxylase-like metal-dependent hydrolase (beta-lactamase superfamily II)